MSEECPELGIWLLECAQGNGYAKEALTMTLQHAQEAFGKTRFFYEADTRNEGSQKLLQKMKEGYDIEDRGVEEFLKTVSQKVILG